VYILGAELFTPKLASPERERETEKDRERKRDKLYSCTYQVHLIDMRILLIEGVSCVSQSVAVRCNVLQCVAVYIPGTSD